MVVVVVAVGVVVAVAVGVAVGVVVVVAVGVAVGVAVVVAVGVAVAVAVAVAVVVAVGVAVAVAVGVDLMAVLMGGGATPYEALRDLTLQLYARRLDPAAPSTPRDGTEILIRVMENVTPSQHPRWVAEARWEPGFRASRKP